MTSIYFQFDESQAVFTAAESLQELGFSVQFLLQVPVHIHGGDLTAALEVAQSSGGRLAEVTEAVHFALAESSMLQQAYGLDGIRVPAHTVTEDLPEAYMHPAGGTEAGNVLQP